MSLVRILVSYGGEWVEAPEAGIFKFTGSKGKGMSVPKSITYQELLNKLYHLLMVDPNEFSISMKVLYSSSLPVPPAEIICDDDVSFFIGENSNVSLRTPLCVTLVRRSSHIQQNGHEGGSSLANFNSMLGTQEQTHKPFVPVAGIEENAPDFCVDNECNVGDGDADDDGNDVDVGTPSAELAPGDVSVEPQLGTGNPQSTHNVADVDPITPVGPATAPTEWVTTREALAAITKETSTATRKEASTAAANKATTAKAKGDSTSSSANQSGELETRQLFSSKKELRAKLSMLAIRENFNFKVQRSTTKLFVAGCTEENCKWILRAVKVRDSTSFQIRKFVKDHSCLTETRDKEHRHANSWLIGQLIKSKCQGMNRTYKPKEIIEDVQRELGVKLSYEKAWRAREVAMNGDSGGEKHHLNGLSSERRKKQRKTSANEDRSPRNKCGRCGMLGHNRQTCAIPREQHPNGSSGGTGECT